MVNKYLPVETDADGFFVQFTDLEDTFTQGEILEETAYNVSEVLSAMLVYRLENNQEIPDPSVITQNSYTAAPSQEVQLE